MNNDPGLPIAGTAERMAQSLHEITKQRFTKQGADAPAGAANPHRPGCAAATWWQRGHDAGPAAQEGAAK